MTEDAEPEDHGPDPSPTPSPDSDPSSDVGATADEAPGRAPSDIPVGTPAGTPAGTSADTPKRPRSESDGDGEAATEPETPPSVELPVELPTALPSDDMPVPPPADPAPPAPEEPAPPSDGEPPHELMLTASLRLSFKWLRAVTEVRWLFLLALVTRALAAWIAPAIRNDSLDLLEAAERMRIEGAASVLLTSHHPASPWLIAELGRWFPPEATGTCLAVLGGALVIWPLHGIARHVGGRHAATAACVFYAALPQAIQVTSVPMDEGLYLPLFLSAVALLLGATVAPLGWARNARLLGCGIMAGGAYLCRPEGLLLGGALVVAAALRARARRAVINSGLVCAGLLAVAAPYVVLLSQARGHLEVTPKKSLAVFFGQAPPGAASRMARRVVDSTPGLIGSLLETVEALTSALTVPLGLLAIAGLLWSSRWRHRRPRAARILVLLLAVPLLAAVARLNAGWGYGGGRHALGAALLLLPFAGEGLYRLGGVFSRSTSRRRFTVFLAVLLCMPLATRGLFLSRGRGSGRAAHLGREIATRTAESLRFDSEVVIASFREPLVAYYADRESLRNGGRARHVRLQRDFGPLLALTRDLLELRRQLAEHLRAEQVDYLVLDLYARERGTTGVSYPGRELARVLQQDGLLEDDVIAVGSELAAFRVRR